MQAFSNFFSCLKDSFCRKKLYTPLLKYEPVLTTAAWSLNCKHFSLVIDQNVHTHTMRILSLTLDGYGHSYPGSTTRFSGSRPTRMMNTLSIHWIYQHNWTCALTQWQQNTVTTRNTQAKLPAPSQPSFHQPTSVFWSIRNVWHPNIPNQLDFTYTEPNIALIFKKTRKAWKLDSVWNNIDMQGLGISFKSLDTPSRHFTSKMLHGWLNTGHQRAKITKDPYSSICPCCQAPDETYEHILRCTAPTVEKTRNEVLKKIAKLDERGSTTWRVFHQAIKNWLKDGDAMKHPCLDNYMMMVGQRCNETPVPRQLWWWDKDNNWSMH